MGYRLLVIVMALWAVGAQAQEKYSEVLARTRTLSPYEAIYQLMDYQQWKPEMAGVYFELGNLCYDLIPTRDALHHYPELSALLYRSKLFYGNCLHFAKDQKLPGWQYDVLAKGEKRIEYATLEQYIRPRLAEVKRQQTACDSIHNTFMRMTERYDRCHALFAAFMKQYKREKTAHLALREEERLMLMDLLLAADSLETDMKEFQEALALQPIKGYAPVFRKEPITLYRLDGLTYTDFLQNDIAIWDYRTWVLTFLYEQKNEYEALYADIDRTLKDLQTQMRDYRAGRKIEGKMDASLLGRCARLEVQRPQVDSIKVLEEEVLNAVAEQTIDNSAAPASVREMVPLLSIAAERRDAKPDEAIRRMKQHLIDMAMPLHIQHKATYVHPVTGETIAYETLPGETVFCLLPDENGYRCVVTDNEGAVSVINLSRALYEMKRPLRQMGETPLVFTKVKGGLWVLITDKDIYWLK